MDIAHLQLLQSDWTLIADLSFADLVLWLPTWNEGGFVAAAQLRPSTSRTHIPDDLVGHFVPRGRHFELDRAFATGAITQGAARPAHSVTRAIPVRRDGHTIAVLGLYTHTPGEAQLEQVYTDCAEDLCAMVTAGEFPRETQNDQGTGGRGGAPRVGDGLIVLSTNGSIEYASPNARSAFRRLGVGVDIEGTVLADIVSSLNRKGVPIDDTLSLVVRGRIQATSEIAAGQSTVTIRSIPLTGREKRTLILVRDVSDIRRRDQALLGKDAAIREIHHRVKNNLQTVASLLRLQGRRLPDEASRIAIAEAGRRVATIAVVHELLAHTPGTTVDFDDVAAKVAALTVETSLLPGSACHIEGHFGVMPSDKATTLALVLAELVANAVEHGGKDQPHLEVNVNAERQNSAMDISVSDNGRGIELPITEDLGLAIVSTLVRDELRGTLKFGHVDETADMRGTIVSVHFPLDQ
jgi:two-component sensor histidine kinase